jgi:SAM-dependent methyltransferase
MIGLPPGTILQLLYIRKRLLGFKKQYHRFLEIGAGNGMISTELLKLGFDGMAVDLNESACRNNRTANARFIEQGRYSVMNDDFMNLENESVDFTISCMVIEHIPEPALTAFIQKAKALLKPGGRMIFLVPSSMKYWGIEDEIAGHVKRYEFEDVEALAKQQGLKVDHVAGLTYPVSNWLFRLSNMIVQKKEAEKMKLSQYERTVYTGNREVQFKTTFPAIFSIILNPVVLWPLHQLQQAFSGNRNSMVLYFELTKDQS